MGIKQEGSPALAYDRINEIASSMFHAHMGVFVKYEDKPLPVTIHTHPAVADFIQDVSGDFTLTLTSCAYICLDNTV